LALVLALSAAAELVNENLLAALPPGYKIAFRDQNKNLLITEMVPAGETVNDWTEMVTVQVFRGLNAPLDQFMNNIESSWIGACKGADGAQPIARAIENGYPTLVWLLSCPLNPGTGRPELTWFKAIQGNDSFYVVQKAFRFMPAKDQIAKWVGYLKAVRVCDSRLKDRACPPTRK